MIVHRFEKKSVFQCMIEHCGKIFNAFTAFQRHVNRNHYFRKIDENRNRNYEMLKSGEPVKCCNQMFLSTELYAVHVFRQHNSNVDSLNLSIANWNVCSANFNVGDDEAVKESEILEISVSNAKSIERQCGKMFLTLLAEHNVTNSAIQTIINLFIEMEQENKMILEQTISKLL